LSLLVNRQLKEDFVRAEAENMWKYSVRKAGIYIETEV
jgi:hypothetical protein